MKLPRGWILEKASETCDAVQSGGTPKGGFSDSGGVPFLKVYNIVNEAINFGYRAQYVSSQVHERELSKSKVKPGDVLMNIVGPPLGKIAIVPPDYPEWNINQAIAVFRPSAVVSSKWIYSFLRGGDSVRSVINETRGIAGQVNISLSQCRDFRFPIPPVAEQRRIVEKLDALTARIARARAELDRVCALASKQRGAVIASHLNQCVRELPRVEFSTRISVLTSGSRDWAKYYDQGDSVFVLAGNIRTLRFDPTPKRYVNPPLDSSDARRSKIDKDDLLVTIVGAGTGDICHVSDQLENYFVCQSVARIKLAEPSVSEFFCFWFASPEHGGAHFKKAIYGAARPHLSFEQLKSFLVPNIGCAAAHLAVAKIKTAFARADRLEAAAKRAHELLDRLESAILVKAFRGELVPQDPNDEPASVLLERIRAQRAAAPAPRRARGPAATSVR